MSNRTNMLERLSLWVGTLLVAVAGMAWFDGVAHSRSSIEDFERAEERLVTPEEQRTWSDVRKTEYQRARLKDAGPTQAILRIPSTGTEVAVFDSTSKTALNRGAGHVSYTALPGTAGNIAIAGHRDGFFRSLKDIEIGATIELTTLDAQQQFRVTETMIVDPLDVSVLDPTEETVITLITCYPFYFVGPAPERFIVRAILVGSPTEREDPEALQTSFINNNVEKGDRQ